MTTFRKITDDLTRSLIDTPKIEKSAPAAKKYVHEEKLSEDAVRDLNRKNSVMGMKSLTEIFAKKKPIPVSATPTPSKKVKLVFPTKLNKV